MARGVNPDDNSPAEGTALAGGEGPLTVADVI
jgi:hypothetical protein